MATELKRTVIRTKLCGNRSSVKEKAQASYLRGGLLLLVRDTRRLGCTFRRRSGCERRTSCYGWNVEKTNGGNSLQAQRQARQLDGASVGG